MTPELALDLRIGKLETTLELYKPIFKELRGISSVVDSMNKIQEDLQFLRESRIKTKGMLANLLKEQDKVHESTTKALQDKEVLVKDEVAKTFEGFETRLNKTEIIIDSFKSKGWETLFAFIPWIIATCTTAWAILK